MVDSQVSIEEMQTRADAKRLKDDAEAVVKVSVTRPGVEKSHELPVEEQQQKIRDGPSNREHVKSKGLYGDHTTSLSTVY